MSNLDKIITPIEGFQYSVNIAYDIYDDKKIRSYIPSNSSLQIIEDILASTDNKSTDRARILTGSYGKGNSVIMVDPASNQTDIWSAYEWSKSSQFNYFKAE